MKETIYLTMVMLLCFTLTQISLAQKDKKNTIIEENFRQYHPQYTYQPEVYEGKEQILLKIPLPNYSQEWQTQWDITQRLHTFLDFVPIYKPPRIEKLTMQGFRIQIYRGKNLEEAKQARQRSYDLYPDITPYLEYKAPTYRVKVGDFIDQTEYIIVYKQLKREFPNALIVPALVNVVIEREKEEESKEEYK